MRGTASDKLIIHDTTGMCIDICNIIEDYRTFKTHMIVNNIYSEFSIIESITIGTHKIYSDLHGLIEEYPKIKMSFEGHEENWDVIDVKIISYLDEHNDSVKFALLNHKLNECQINYCLFNQYNIFHCDIEIPTFVTIMNANEYAEEENCLLVSLQTGNILELEWDAWRSIDKKIKRNLIYETNGLIYVFDKSSCIIVDKHMDVIIKICYRKTIDIASIFINKEGDFKITSKSDNKPIFLLNLCK